MIDLQAYIDVMSEKWKSERAETQMTLGELIEALESMPENTEIKGLGELNSYRGYYSDLAFEPTNEISTAKEVLYRCKAAMGQVFEGYKGGDFVMGARTPLWKASYGYRGDRIMNINKEGIIELAPDED